MADIDEMVNFVEMAYIAEMARSNPLRRLIDLLRAHVMNLLLSALAVDDNYSMQLAEVHSKMTSFSHRVSGDVDLCHMDIIGAIDTLVEKMALELQAGTLSTSDVMAE